MPLAARAVTTLLDRVAGNVPTPLGQSFVGSNISIGRRYGTIQLAHGDDTPRSFYVGGKMAATIKEYVCTMVVRQIAKESQARVLQLAGRQEAPDHYLTRVQQRRTLVA